AHCRYLMGLSALGLGEKEKAREELEKAVAIDFNHQMSRIYLKLADE
ncbi:MAG: hypothetical protein IJ073_03710, partial [Lachnospiraceae bacterium]|nr:hypothetical protein [Lachnospiraceae bacterium]